GQHPRSIVTLVILVEVPVSMKMSLLGSSRDCSASSACTVPTSAAGVSLTELPAALISVSALSRFIGSALGSWGRLPAHAMYCVCELRTGREGTSPKTISRNWIREFVGGAHDRSVAQLGQSASASACLLIAELRPWPIGTVAVSRDQASPRGDPSALTRCTLMSSCAAASIRSR